MIPGFWIAWIVKATALFALAWLVALALRRASAAVRHLTWAVALLGSLTLPALMWTLPAWRTPAVTTVTPAFVEGPIVSSRTNSIWDPPPAPFITTERALTFLWFAGFSFVMGRLAIGLLQVRRWQKGARTLPPPSGFPPRVRLLESSSSAAMPLTWGYFRPKVLLPAGWREWPEARLRHVLAHEAAHVVRRDWIVQISAELACAVCWFHPLVWLVARGLREEAERACDDLVLRSGAVASDYAGHLVDLARVLKSPAGAVSATLAVARPSSLERRVTAMLNASLDRRPISTRDRWMYVLLTAFILAPLAALAQSQEIRGVVIESGTNHGIEDAEIVIRKMDRPREIGQPLRTPEVGKVKTDAQGGFIFRPDEFAEYVLVVQKDGFSPITGSVVGIPSSQINVILSKERPSREVRFELGRPGEITGRVVDYDTDEPIPNFRVNISPLLYTRGLRIQWPPFGIAVTDSEGRFRAPNLTPNRYVAEINSQLAQKDMLLKEFSADDAAIVDQDYELAYLPGGPELDSALPVPLASGGFVDMGTLRARKTPHYRALVSIADTNCAPGATVRLTLFLKSHLGGATQVAGGETQCGKEVIFRNLSRREYWLSARTAAPAARVQAEVQIALTSRNETVRVTLAKGPDIVGRFLGAEGAQKFDWEKLQLAPSDLGSVNFRDELAPAQADSQGRFRLENRLPGIKRVGVVGLPPGAFVKQMRYRGIPLATNIFRFTGDGELEIEIDDQPAIVTGAVRTSSEPVERAHVALIRWPMDTIEPFASITRASADEDGKFQFSALPGGEYRLFALTPENRDRVEEPGVLQRLLPRAETVILNRGASRTISLTPLDPAR